MTSTVSSILAVSLALFAPSVVYAQNSALAESLFREGKKALDAKHYDEACPKLAESARLDAASGTLLALGLCHEGQGKIASAWADYSEAATVAKRDGRTDREKAARAKVASLEPKIPRLTITSASSDVVVKQDGTTIGSAAWKDAPIDPGEHAFEVTATGKKPYKTTLAIAASEHKTLEIPALEDEPKAQQRGTGAATETPAVSSSSSSPLRPIGFVTGGVGLGMLVVGSIVGGLAIGKNNEGKMLCPMKACSNPDGVSANHSAESLADVSTALFIIGGITTATGIVLVLVAPKSTVTVAPTANGIVIGGRF